MTQEKSKQYNIKSIERKQSTQYVYSSIFIYFIRIHAGFITGIKMLKLFCVLHLSVHTIYNPFLYNHHLLNAFKIFNFSHKKKNKKKLYDFPTNTAFNSISIVILL